MRRKGPSEEKRQCISSRKGPALAVLEGEMLIVGREGRVDRRKAGRVGWSDTVTVLAAQRRTWALPESCGKFLEDLKQEPGPGQQQPWKGPRSKASIVFVF